MTESLINGAAVPLPIRATAVVASAVVKAARQLLTDLELSRRVDAAVLRKNNAAKTSGQEAAFESLVGKKPGEAQGTVGSSDPSPVLTYP